MGSGVLYCHDLKKRERSFKNWRNSSIQIFIDGLLKLKGEGLHSLDLQISLDVSGSFDVVAIGENVKT